jgi:hypothetical protein
MQYRPHAKSNSYFLYDERYIVRPIIWRRSLFSLHYLFLENVIMQAIQTKRLPCTNTKPTRIKAWCFAGSITMSVHSIPREYKAESHHYVAEQLQKKLNWIGPQYGFLESGTLPDGTMAHVMVKIPL